MINQLRNFRFLLTMVLFFSLIGFFLLYRSQKPNSSALAIQTGRLYVANSSSDSISIIDTGNNTVITTIPISQPIDLKLSQDNTRLYVLQGRPTSSVAIINTANNTTISTIQVGSDVPGSTGFPVSMAVNPAGTRIYTGNQDSNTVVVVDTSTSSVAATISVDPTSSGIFPLALALNPSGTLLYVEVNGDFFKIIDTSNNTIINTISLTRDFPGMVFNSAGTRLYLTNSDGDFVVLDSTNNTELARIIINTANATPVLGSNDSILYSTGGTCSIAKVDVVNYKWLGVIPLLMQGGCTEVALSPNGNKLYVTNTGANTVSVVDKATERITDIIPVGKAPTVLVVKP